MPSAMMTSKGQVTIPKDVRDSMGIGPGDRLDFVRMEDGNYAVIPATTTIKSLKGLIAKPKKPVTNEEMDEAIARGARSR